MRFPSYRQYDQMDCGPTCLRIIAKYYGKSYSLEMLRNISETTREGSSLSSISDAAEKIGLKSIGARVSFEQLEELPLPAIVFWEKKHFIVVYKIKKNKVYVSDPGFGLATFTKEEFIAKWIGNNATTTTKEGLILLLEPTHQFYEKEDKTDSKKKKSEISFLFRYIKPYRLHCIQLIIGLIAGSLIQLVFPFLTQNIVDIGIQGNSLNFIHLILVGQLFLFVGKLSLDIIQNWLLLHMSSRINISLISDFFIKLTHLPIAYFDSKMTGDLMRRIEDHQKIERVLTSGALKVLFPSFNLFIFSLVLWHYNTSIVLIFLFGSALLFSWVLFFMNKRKELDHKGFEILSEEKSKVIELINGMQEIKLHNSERKKRWSWEYIQARLFKLKIKSLSLANKQNTGSMFINEVKNITITAYAAQLVLTGDITLGMMLSIAFIIGQLNGPILSMIEFIYQYQDAKLSLGRLREIHNHESEDDKVDFSRKEMFEKGDIIIDNLSFKYKGTRNLLFENLNLVIPKNKVTAIVGASGSGKTTLMKLIMKFYEPTKGNISIGQQNLININNHSWRDQFGAVMQEGFIFNDSIAENIVVGDDIVDEEKLVKSVEMANIKNFIEDNALGYNTKIGQDGVGISGGQKQRILIARAIYKNPPYIFFDEATSSLDANNEKKITRNLNRFLRNKTAVIIAHRLSTVKNADKIVVLDKGKIVEEGTHEDLVRLKGAYYSLVKNQLELEKINDYAYTV